MKKVLILFLLISFCGGSSESTSTQPQQDQELSQDGIAEKILKNPRRLILMNNLIPHPVKNLEPESKQRIDNTNTPRHKRVYNNKSDRFFVDFEDIAGHPYENAHQDT